MNENNNSQTVPSSMQNYPRRHIIINADDFGLSRSVNQAIIDVYKKGNLTSTTLLVNMPGTEDAIQQAESNPDLAVGLHFCLTEGRPLTICKSLTQPDGAFLSRPNLVKKLYSGKVNPQDIRTEFEAQINRFRSYGLKLSHVDSHQHILMLPRLSDPVLPLILENQLPIRVVRPPTIPWSLLVSRPTKIGKQLLNRILSRRLLRSCAGKTNEFLVSIHDLTSQDNLNPNTYRQLVSTVPRESTVELMVHPYLLDDELRQYYDKVWSSKASFLHTCVQEYKALTQERLFSSNSLTKFREIVLSNG